MTGLRALRVTDRNPLAPSGTGTPNSYQTVYKKDDRQRVDGCQVALRWKAASELEFGAVQTQQNQVVHGNTGNWGSRSCISAIRGIGTNPEHDKGRDSSLQSWEESILDALRHPRHVR